MSSEYEVKYLGAEIKSVSIQESRDGSFYSRYIQIELKSGEILEYRSEEIG